MTSNSKKNSKTFLDLISSKSKSKSKLPKSMKSNSSNSNSSSLNVNYWRAFASAGLLDTFTSNNVRVPYKPKLMDAVYDDIDAMTHEKILGFFILSQPVQAVFGEFQHWSIKFITDNCYVYIDFRINTNQKSEIHLRMETRNPSDTKLFLKHGYDKNTGEGGVFYDIVTAFVPKIQRRCIDWYERKYNFEFDIYCYVKLFDALQHKKIDGYIPLEINKEIGDLREIIGNWKLKYPNGYHFMKNNCQTFVIYVVKQLLLRKEKNNKKYYHYAKELQDLNNVQESTISRVKEQIKIYNTTKDTEEKSNENDNNSNGKFTDNKDINVKLSN